MEPQHRLGRSARAFTKPQQLGHARRVCGRDTALYGVVLSRAVCGVSVLVIMTPARRRVRRRRCPEGGRRTGEGRRSSWTPYAGGVDGAHIREAVGDEPVNIESRGIGGVRRVVGLLVSAQLEDMHRAG